jgi:MarR family transcriptional regulator, temperature-dependent positive regulator of motility
MANGLARAPAAKAQAATPRGESSRRNGDLELGVLTSSLGYLLRRLQLAYKKHFLLEARSSNLQPRHVGAMYVIGLNPGVTPSQMSAALGLDAVQTALMLNALEERGLAVRRLSRTDGRSRAVHLTPAGRRAFAKLQVIATRVEQDFVSAALSPQETAQLISLMTRLLGDR